MPEDALAYLAWAAVCVVAGLALFLAEFFIISFGVLGTAAGGCMIAAIVLAFLAGPLPGAVACFLVPLASILTIRSGLRRMQRSRLVVQAEIDDDAGYHHFTEQIGVAVGSVGELVTHARPTGRARFPGGECDVQVRGQVLDRGAGVEVIAIDGSIIHVRGADSDAASTLSSERSPS